MSFPEKILREKLAELEHEQWMEWSKEISRKEELSIERLKRWQNLWKPYNELPEVEKEQDRVWADKVLAISTEDQKERKIDVIEEFAWLIKEYAFVDDIKLTKDAIELKQRILKALEPYEKKRKQKLQQWLDDSGTPIRKWLDDNGYSHITAHVLKLFIEKELME